jgi:Zn-dependent peptidase ImmA (M78 family)
MTDHASLMTKAEMLRRRLGMDSSSPLDIFRISQSIEGLTVVFYPMGDNLSGMCVKGQNGNSVVAVNSSMTLGRQRFSLAHEFYHLYYDDAMISVCAKKLGDGKDTERAADMFASYFLMPDASLMEMVEGIVSERKERHLGTDDIIRIGQYYGVSHRSVVYRLSGTQFLSRKEAESLLNIPVRKMAEALGYSPDLYRPSPESGRYMTYGNYIKQANAVLERGLVSEGKYEELLLEAFRGDLVYGTDEGGDVID